MSSRQLYFIVTNNLHINIQEFKQFSQGHKARDKDFIPRSAQGQSSLLLPGVLPSQGLTSGFLGMKKWGSEDQVQTGDGQVEWFEFGLWGIDFACQETGLGLGWQNWQQKIEGNGTERIPTPGLTTLRCPWVLHTDQGSVVAA